MRFLPLVSVFVLTFGCLDDPQARVDEPLDAGVDGLDGGTDAGDIAVDAGADAGLDASADAGLDAGVDAGFDAGEDAGVDAGTDAGTCPSSDDFEGTVLSSCWTSLEPTAGAATLEGGRLVIRQQPFWSWSNGVRGFLLYQPVTGNFSAQVRASLSRTDGGPGFPLNYAAAALIGFHPSSPAANHLVSIGTLGAGDVAGALSQHTDSSSRSSYFTQASGGFIADLRLCRFAGEVRGYFRELDAGATWQALPAFVQADGGAPVVPTTLFVGPGAYNVEGAEAALAAFDGYELRLGLTALSQCEDP